MAGHEFPQHFLWGTATSAYQVEGSPLADGAGPSIWHRFTHTPNLVRDGATGDVACDHYRRYLDDVAMMRTLGTNAYRFSISWSRVVPRGRRAVNPAGLDFYERLVDALLANGIEPMVTLYHWDLPAAPDDRNRFEAPLASHHLLRAHAEAVKAYRVEGRHRIGIVVNLEPKYSASDDPADQAATARADAYMNRQYLDPIFLGRYPDELGQVFGEAWPRWPADDLALIQQPIDFVGVNYYTRSVTRFEPQTWLLQAAPVPQPRSTYTETGWEVFAPALTDTLVWVKERYDNPPTYVTENGAAFFDPPALEGDRLADPLRVDYLRKHIRAVHAAIERGVDVRGYFVWSLLDNFEWSLGYSKRFGIVHVDFETQKRTPKDSALFYARVIASNGHVLNDPPAPPPA